MKARFFLLVAVLNTVIWQQLYASDTANFSSQLALETAVLPEMAAISDVRQKKETFFAFLEPIVDSLNKKIQAERAWLKVIEKDIERGSNLELWQQSLLAELSRYYKIDEEPGSKAFFTQIYKRVDTIPTSLVLAQAANESAWGTSRFAVEGNNLFGQWCFTKGCGLVPSGRNDEARHEVKVFDSVADSVASYLRNLNTHTQYAALRTIREELRYLKLPVDSTFLVWGLEGYSIRGEHYIRELIDMIQYNRLQNYDHPTFYATNDIDVAVD